MARANPKRSKEAKEEKYYYKTFRVRYDDDGETYLESPAVGRPFKLQYFIGKKTKPQPEMLEQGYGIMIFETVEQANAWCGRVGHPYRPILRVKVGKVFDVPEKRVHIDTTKYLINGDAKAAFPKESRLSWKTMVGRLLKFADVEGHWPEGSKMASWVIPVADDE